MSGRISRLRRLRGQQPDASKDHSDFMWPSKVKTCSIFSHHDAAVRSVAFFRAFLRTQVIIEQSSLLTSKQKTTEQKD